MNPPASEAAPQQQRGPPPDRNALHHRSNADFAHGNFSNYYGVRTKSHQLVDRGAAQARPTPHTSQSHLDPRVEAFLEWYNDPASAASSSDRPAIRRILDIGCNDGTIGFQVASQIPDIELLSGVDIDPTLVRRAQARAQAQEANQVKVDQAVGTTYRSEFRCADWVYADQAPRSEGPAANAVPCAGREAEDATLPASKKQRLERAEEGFDLILA